MRGVRLLPGPSDGRVIGRKRTLSLPDGSELQTPLLVPSVSSSRSNPLEIDGKQRSYVAITLDALRSELTQTLLVSALDLARELLFEAEDLLAGAGDTIFSGPRLLIIDSGCYEERDQSEWSPEDHNALIARLPESSVGNVAFVNFDRASAYSEQISSAQDQLGGHEKRVKICLLKPPEDARAHNLEALTAHVRSLQFADVVGVAEKDLGETLGDRLRGVKKIRQMLDDGGLGEKPLHLFGGLDPVLSPFYFAAGADIFDGLTWMQYSYRDGLGCYSEAVSILDGDLAHRTAVRELHRCQRNLLVLRNVQDNMRLLAAGSDWSDLGEHGARIRQAFRQAAS